MEKLNIAELLRNCPRGMELDCTMFEGIEFDSIVDNECFPIRCRIKNSNDEYNFYSFTKHGYWNNDYKAKCVIFPKGKTTWEGFVPPCNFKDGDVIFTHTDVYAWVSIFNQFSRISCCTYIDLCINDNDLYINDNDSIFDTRCLCDIEEINTQRLATEEEKERLFQAIKEHGYKWNSETKTLEKLPQFKVGDRIRHKDSGIYCTLGEYSEGISAYRTNIGLAITYKDLEQWELIPQKFDITTLVPFESRVLVRDIDHYEWEGAIFGRYDGKNFYTIGGLDWKCCIPYEGNEYLFGTTNDCSEYYKTWEE